MNKKVLIGVGAATVIASLGTLYYSAKDLINPKLPEPTKIVVPTLEARTPTPFNSDIEITVTPTPLTLDDFVDDKLSYTELSVEQINSFNHLGHLEETYGVGILQNKQGTLTPDSAVALSSFLNNFSENEQIRILASPMSPLKFTDVKSYLIAGYDMSPIHAAVVTDSFRRYGWDVLINNIMRPSPTGNVYRATENFHTDDGEMRTDRLGYVVQDLYEKLKDYINVGSFQEIAPGVSETRDYDLESFVRTANNMEIQENDPVVFYYLTHNDLARGKLAGLDFNDLYGPEELFPNALLENLQDRTLIAYIDSCPEGFVDDIKEHLESYNEIREDNPLDYMVIVGSQQDDTFRRIPAGDMAETIWLATHLYEKDHQDSPYFNHPLTSIGDLIRIIEGDNSLENEMSENGLSRNYIVRPYIRTEDGKELSPYGTFVDLRINSEQPYKDNRDNMAIAIDVITNIDLENRILYNMPLGTMNLEYK